MKRLLAKLLVRYIKSIGISDLSKILVDHRNREFFLGVADIAPLTDEQMKAEAHKIVNFAKSEDYAAFAKEAWAQVIFCVDKLSTPTTPDSEVGFYRGALHQAMNLLRKSHDYRSLIEMEIKEKKLA